MFFAGTKVHKSLNKTKKNNSILINPLFHLFSVSLSFEMSIFFLMMQRSTSCQQRSVLVRSLLRKANTLLLVGALFLLHMQNAGAQIIFICDNLNQRSAIANYTQWIASQACIDKSVRACRGHCDPPKQSMRLIFTELLRSSQ